MVGTIVPVKKLAWCCSDESSGLIALRLFAVSWISVLGELVFSWCRRFYRWNGCPVIACEYSLLALKASHLRWLYVD